MHRNFWQTLERLQSKHLSLYDNAMAYVITEHGKWIFFFVGWMKKVEKLRLTPTYWISTDYLNYALMDVLFAPIVTDFSFLFRASFIAFECCFYSNCMHLFGYNCLLHRSIRKTTKEQPKCHTIDRTKPKTLYANEKWINGITMTQ